MQEVGNPDFEIKDYLKLASAFTSYVVITAHRRESFGRSLIEICSAVAELAEKFPAMGFIFSVHRNPVVRRTVRKILQRIPKNLYLVAPLSYEVFINILAGSRLALTDSGGIQEEASALGVKTLILRRVTERPEALEAGARLVPLSRKAIVSAVSKQLKLPLEKGKQLRCPFGDGRAAERIAQAVAWAWGRRKKRPRPFVPRTRKIRS
jgi:UDP-N-acetylglucosamine 2-epimerase (non-hydrolysing)